MNEKGSTTLNGVIILLFISMWGTQFIEKKIHTLKDSQLKMELALCSKRLNGELTTLTKVTNITNKTLAALTAGQYASVFIPGLGLSTAVSINRAIQLLKKYQVGRELWTLKTLIQDQYVRSCINFKTAGIRPFKSKRDALNRRIRKKKRIQYSVKRQKWIINSTLNTITSKTKSKMTKAWYSLN